MSEMVERVARAIWNECNEVQRTRGHLSFVLWDDEDMNEPDRVWFRKRARAAIAAMREPTAAMIRNGDVSSSVEGGPPRRIHWPDAVGPEDVWTFMIDAALTPSTGA